MVTNHPEPPHLTDRGRLGWYLLVASGVSLAVIGVLAMVTHRPWVFPSLGPTAFIVFASPLAQAASPRSVFFGHLVGVIAGALALLAFGLYSMPPDLQDVSWQRIGAVVFAVGLTLAVMTWLDVAHAPAAATTMIVALGLLRSPGDLVVMMLAVLAMIVLSLIINRIHGTKVPIGIRRRIG